MGNYMPRKQIEPAAAKDAGPNAKAADSYHHGDLRTALIAAAREALEATRPEDITLKSLALRLGVSQPAPYRHFSSREALLAAVAADGFVRFSQFLREAAGSASEAERFEQSALAYLAFGRANIGVYRLMFASRLMTTVDDGPLSVASTASFDMLLDGLANQIPADQLHAVAIWVWSTLHGLVMLEAEGLASGPHRSVTSAQVIRQMVDTLAQRARS